MTPHLSTVTPLHRKKEPLFIPWIDIPLLILGVAFTVTGVALIATAYGWI